MAALCSASSLMGYTLGATIFRKTSFFIADNDTVDCSGGAFRLKRVYLVLILLLAPVVMADQFPNQNQNSGFVGWQIGEDGKIGEFRLSYPSISDGEETNMASQLLL